MYIILYIYYHLLYLFNNNNKTVIQLHRIIHRVSFRDNTMYASLHFVQKPCDSSFCCLQFLSFSRTKEKKFSNKIPLRQEKNYHFLTCTA